MGEKDKSENIIVVKNDLVLDGTKIICKRFALFPVSIDQLLVTTLVILMKVNFRLGVYPESISVSGCGCECVCDHIPFSDAYAVTAKDYYL